DHVPARIAKPAVLERIDNHVAAAADRNQRLADGERRTAISKPDLDDRAGSLGDQQIAKRVTVGFRQCQRGGIIGSADPRRPINGQLSPYLSDHIKMCHGKPSQTLKCYVARMSEATSGSPFSRMSLRSCGLLATASPQAAVACAASRAS